MMSRSQYISRENMVSCYNVTMKILHRNHTKTNVKWHVKLAHIHWSIVFHKIIELVQIFNNFDLERNRKSL